MSTTQNFDLESFGPEGRISDNNYKFSSRDRDTIDALLHTLMTHDHRDVGSNVAMAGANERPDLTLSTTGGTLGSGQTIYYKFSYVDSFGNETEASVANSISTANPLPSPPVMGIETATTGGTLDPGIYKYSLAYYQSGIGVTKATNIASINVPVGTSTNTITLTLDTLPTGATGWRIYRKGPGDIDYFWLDTITSGPTYEDDGLDLAIDCTKIRPTGNTTNSTNKIVVSIASGDLPLDTRVVAWKIYRTTTIGFFGPASLLATVVDTTTEAGTDLVTSYTDTGSITFSGSPLAVTVVPAPIPQLDPSDVFTGDTRLQAKHAPQGIHALATSMNGTLAVQDYNQWYVPEDMPLERIDVFFQTAPTGVDGSNYLTVRVSDDAVGNAVQSVYNTSKVENEKQSVYNNATSGTFTLSDGVDTTLAIAFDALATVIETRLETDITSITDVQVTGTGLSTTPWVIEWLDPGATDVSYVLIAGDGGLTGGASTVSVYQNGSDGGVFLLTYDGQTTTPLDWDELGVKAQGTLTMDTQPTDTDTMTVDGKVYTFQDTLTDVDGNVKIGAALANTQANIVAAFDLSGTAGTDYATSMTAHTSVDMAAFATDDSVLTAKADGKAGNSLATTETFTAGTNVFDAVVLGTTTAGVDPLEPELEALSTITSVNVTGSGTLADPWLVEFVNPGSQEVDIMTSTDGVKAQGTLTMDTQVTDTDTMTVGAKTYTFQTTLTDVDGNVQIGATLSDTQDNIVAAFDLSGVAGTDYATSMTAHPTVDMAAFATDDSVLTAKVHGIAGNSLATTETFTAGTNIFDAVTLGTTTAGVDLNGTTYISMDIEGFAATQEEVIVDAAQAYHFWQSSATDFGEIEGEDATGDGVSVSDALATNDVAVYLDAQTDTQTWDIGTGIDEGDYIASFYVSVDDGAVAEIRVVDQFGGDTTIASTTISDGSSYLPAHTLSFSDTGSTEDWKFEVEKTDAGVGQVRVDKFEYVLRNPLLHKGSTATLEVLVTGSPTTNGDDAQVSVWY